MNALDRIGIIIVTYQSERHIGPLLRSLAATIDRERTTICVFDNASTDGTAAVFESENRELKLPVRFVRSESNLGFARANNQAFELLRKETPCGTIVLLNPDTVVHDNWRQPLMETLDKPGVGTVSPLLLMPDGTINARGDALHFLGIGFVLGYGESVSSAIHADDHFFFGSGAAVAFRVETLERVNAQFGLSGIFWEDLFMYAEDTDLGWRMRLAGLDNLLTSQRTASLVTHDYQFWSRNVEESQERMFWIERNRYLLLVSNLKWPTLILMSPWIIGSEIALSLGLWKLYPHRVKLWRAIATQMRSPAFWERRRRLQAGRTASDRAILRAMTGSIRHGARAHSFGLLDRILNAVLDASHRFLCTVVWW